MNFGFKITALLTLVLLLMELSSCKKDKLITNPNATVSLSDDSVLFDTVFTSIGSATRNIRVRNRNSQKINISSIRLLGGTSSQFIVNVDGAKGTSFSDIEIAAKDSMYIFIQVNVKPNNANSPLIIEDELEFVVNGNSQTLKLEAWGQDAYYHKPDSAIYFKDKSYLAYSLVSDLKNSYTYDGSVYTWKNDKPHVIYGYLVVDEKQKLKIPAGTQVYMNYKAGLWVFSGGQLQVLGQKDKEVVFQGARRDKDYADEPGQWDRIWINEGSDQNIIDYAIIKNGYIGVQAEIFGDDTALTKKRQLTLTNTKIQNMSLWGLYSLAYNIYAGNNVITNCQEHSLNIQLGGAYSFIHCTFANYWAKDKPRDKPAVNINNYSDLQSIPVYAYFGNCIIDGKLDNELNLDVKYSFSSGGSTYTSSTVFSNSFIKTTTSIADTTRYINVRKGATINYKDVTKYDFEPAANQAAITAFTHSLATQDAKVFPQDIRAKLRNVTSVTAGAYETQ